MVRRRVRAAIGLGSNVGDRESHLRSAVTGLTAAGAVVAMSSMYETEPLGGVEQGPFLNAVVLLETALTPRQLLDRCLEIERSRGRERTERWGPRTLDLDILLYGDVAVIEPDLVIPHPRLAERRFALEPLLEVWPGAAAPDGTPIAPLLSRTGDQVVRRHRPDVSRAAPTSVQYAVVFVTTGLLAVLVWLGLGYLLDRL